VKDNAYILYMYNSCVIAKPRLLAVDVYNVKTETIITNHWSLQTAEKPKLPLT